MAKNQSTYTLKIDAELGNLQQILNQAKNSLSSFMASGNAPKGLEKAFEKINELLGQISDKTGKPLDLKGLTATGKDLTSVQENFKAIIRLLGEFDDLSGDIKLSFLSGDEQKKIQDASKALSDYGKAMEEVAKKQKLLDTAQKANTKDKGILDKAKKKVGGLQDDRTLVQARLSGAQTKLNTAKGLENANPKDIARYEAEVAKLTAELTILDKNLDEANKELNTAQTAYNTSAQSIKKMESEIKRASGASLKQLKEEATALGISLDGLNGHNAAKQVEILTNRLEEFKQETMKGAKPAFDAIKQGCEKAEVAADGLQDELKEAVEATKQMDEAAVQRDAFESKIKSFLGLSGAAQVLRAALRDAMQTITELDAVMGQMAVVTDLTVGDYWDQLPEYSERASKLGVSITSAYEAATLYYQQGLKANEVTALSEQTLKMAAIAGLDAADATDRMTAALRGFNMELNEANAQNIADVYSELAAITAADVDEISTAMTKTASIASSAGMEFETTAAFLSQIIETTRESAETAGTAMKTVIARFQELKKSPSEIGEIDGEIVDANAIETALRSVGVSLRDSSGQFRELDEVFLELSSKWDGLDKNTQRYIATIAAGSRQQSRFIAMMSDYKRTTELVTAANTSAGASNKQFEKTMDTLEYKVNQLKNAWHEFTMGIMNSDLVKFGVDVLTKFLEVVNKATGALDGVGGSLTKIISVVGIFKLGKQIFDKFMPTISGFFTNITKEAYTGGLNAGKAFQQGLEDSKKQEVSSNKQNVQQEILRTGYFRDKNGRVHGPDGKFATEDAAKRTGWEKFGDKTIGLNKWQEGITHGRKGKEAKDKLKELKKDTSDYVKVQKEALDETQKMWESYGEAVEQTGKTIMGVGVAASALGGILSSLGLEETGEAFATFGNYATLAGTALMGVAQILKYIPVLLNAIMANPIAAIVIAALSVILITVTAIFKHIKDNSPEAKLKKAQEAAEKAAEAADKAKEAYEGLSSAFESLQDKYAGLDELTKGTREWNEAVLELNSSVMDLIKQYPELTKFVKNTDGVLRIDFANPEVQNILDSALEASIGAQNVSSAAEIAVLEAQADKDRANLGTNFQYDTQYWTGDRIVKASEGATASDGQHAVDLKLSNEQIDIFAKAVANGELVDKNSEAYGDLDETIGITEEQLRYLEQSIEENKDSIIEYGRALQQKERQEKLMYDNMASSVVNLVDTLGMSEERIKQMYNIVDGDDYQQAYHEMAEKLTDNIIDNDSADGYGSLLKASGLTEAQMKEAFTQAGYTDGVFNVDTHKVEYKNEKGETVSKKLDNEEVRRIVSTYHASSVVQNRAEYSDAYISRMSAGFKEKGEFKNTVTSDDGSTREITASGDAISIALEKALQDESGDLLTREDLNALSALKKDDYITVFEQLPQVLKDTFGSVDNFYNDVQAAMTGAGYLSNSGFMDVSSGAARNLDKIKEAGGGQAFEDSFNTLIANLDDSQKEYFAQQIASLGDDPKNREAWDAALERLTDAGIDGAANFVAAQQAALGAKYSDTFLKNLGVSDEMIANYNKTTDGAELDKFHTTFKKWKKDYDTVNSEAAKADHELITQTIEAIIENREKQIQAYEDAANAQAEANSNLISKISDNVARLRELREKEETEKAISENLSQQAYLGMDTSGANALSILNLQKENEQMVQDYEDSLVDQAIAKLEDDNQKALEQRERQIELMRQQLEIYSNSDQILQDAKELIDQATEDMLSGKLLSETGLGELLKPEQFQSELQAAEFWTKLYETVNGRIQSDGGNEGEGLPKEKTQEEQDAEDRKKAINNAISASGDNGVLSTDQYKEYKNQYVQAKGTEEEFNTKMSGLGIGIGTTPEITYTGKDLSGYWKSESVFNSTDLANGEKDEGVIKYDQTYYHLTADGKSTRKFANNTTANGDLEVVKEPGTNKAKLYINFSGTGYEIIDEFDRKSLLSSLKLQPYKTGGLADFTGPAWLDGTPSRPEYVLNAAQTERFFSLVDVLEGIDTKDSGKKPSGDNYFDIEINVDKLENDYDVEQVADKIRRMIYDDATYRNVNAINHIR